MIKQLLIHTTLFVLFIWGFLFGFQYLRYSGANSGEKNIKIQQTMEPKKTAEEIGNNPFVRFPDSVVRTKMFHEGKLVTEVEYEIDKFLCRKPITSNPTAVKHALFTGCSFVYGTHLQANQTLPYFFQNTTTEYSDVNLGFPGGGIQHVLKHQESFKWQDMLPQKAGYLFYVFIKDHLNRFHSNHRYLSWAHKSSPVYKVESDAVVSAGQVQDLTERQRIDLAKKVKLSKLYVNYYNKDYFDEFSIKEFVAAVEEAKHRYTKLFPAGEFIFVFHPLAESKETSAYLKAFLDAKKIRFIDAEEAFLTMLKNDRKNISEYRLSVDEHPNAKVNEWLANYLHQEIAPKEPEVPIAQGILPGDLPGTNPDGTPVVQEPVQDVQVNQPITQ